MCGNPRLLNLVSGALVGMALLGFSVTGLLTLLRSEAFPLRTIVLASETSHLTQEQVAAAVRPRLRGNFFSVDIAEVRAAVQALPWVRRATVRRVWPDRLEIAVEYRPVQFPLLLRQLAPKGLRQLLGQLIGHVLLQASQQEGTRPSNE